MAATQRKLLQALDYITMGSGPQIEALGSVRTSHFRKATHAAEDDNVVAIGISEKFVENRASGELALCFYVKKKRPPTRVSADKAIPSVINMPGDEAVFTDVKELGEVVPEMALPQRKKKPIQSGFSVGHFKITAGTVGAIVRKGGRYHILSNSHVLADSGKGSAGDAVLYPGPDDGGTLAHSQVARLAAFVPFDKGGSYGNQMDAALAEIDEEQVLNLDLAIHRAAYPLKIAVAKRGMTVVKSGRTTGKSEGNVLDVNFRVLLTYPGVGKIGFLDQILCTRYTDGGDSGSLVVDKGTGKIVGLHFAGANNGSVFNPIGVVKKALGFRFVAPI